MKIAVPACLFLIVLGLLLEANGATKQGESGPLSVRIISIREGERVHGNISVEAQINRPEDVSYVEFYIQEPGAEDRYSWMAYAPPYVWGGKGQTLDTTLFDDGPASAVAFCFPKAKGAPMVQHRVHFIIDNGKPRVKILSPKDGMTIDRTIVIQVDATDPKGIRKDAGVIALSLYVDGGLFKRLTKPPYAVRLDTCLLTPGPHSIRAVAEDTEGLLGADTVVIGVGGGNVHAPMRSGR